METKPYTSSILIRTITGVAILGSIALTYHTMIVRNDYEVFTNPDGPEIEEE